MARLVIALLGLWTGIGTAADSEHHDSFRNIEVFYGVIPSQVLLTHPIEHAERKMHHGVPPGADQYHLIVSVFDERTKQRIVDADVSASISSAGLQVQRKKLESMEFAGAVTYGNYFRMPQTGPYRIVVDVKRVGSPRPVSTRFEYSHPRRLR